MELILIGALVVILFLLCCAMVYYEFRSPKTQYHTWKPKGKDDDNKSNL